jgi:hypothetical protein
MAWVVMKIDKKLFFDGYRAEFKKLLPLQVQPLQTLLEMIEQDNEIDCIHHAAYMLATVKHECADTYKPITEFGMRRYFDKYNTGTTIGKRLGNVMPDDGYKYRGRGYVQITGRSNYGRMGKEINQDLLESPGNALIQTIAYKIMSHGMRNGLFTGVKLSQFVTNDRQDYRNARKIINGVDQCELISEYAVKFENILKQSVMSV